MKNTTTTKKEIINRINTISTYIEIYKDELNLNRHDILKSKLEAILEEIANIATYKDDKIKDGFILLDLHPDEDDSDLPFTF